MQKLQILNTLRVLNARYSSTYVSSMRHLMKLKEDDEECLKALKSADLLLFHKLAPLLQKHRERVLKPARLPTAEVEQVLEKLGGGQQLVREAVLVSCPDTYEPCFCLDLGVLGRSEVESLCGGVFMDFRKAAFMLTESDWPLLAKAQALLHWHQTHGFCSASGQPTVRNQAGSERTCSASGITYYPQMAPVVIVLVSDGSRCLLGRQASFLPGMYSALAGFCDIGETLEETVRRELAEEVGLEVDTLSYSTSQHWPFPHSSFMVACHATVSPDKTQVSVNAAELEDARWFSLDEILTALKMKTPPRNPTTSPTTMWIPPPLAVANQLIQQWADQQQQKQQPSGK